LKLDGQTTRGDFDSLSSTPRLYHLLLLLLLLVFSDVSLTMKSDDDDELLLLLLEPELRLEMPKSDNSRDLAVFFDEARPALPCSPAPLCFPCVSAMAGWLSGCLQVLEGIQE
jgi:hypothetical protein